MSGRPDASLFAEVALPVPLPRTFTYRVPERMSKVLPGVRVRVRFGTQVLVGCVTRVMDSAPVLPDGTTIKPIVSVVDDEPVVPPSALKLAAWIADYYVASPGLIVRGMLPPETPRRERERFARVPQAQAKTTALAEKVLDVLDRPMTARAIAQAVGKKSVAGTLTSLVEKGLIERRRDSGERGGRRIRVARLTEVGAEALGTVKLHPTSTRILTLLSVATDPVPITTIRHELGIERGPFARLELKGYIAIDSIRMSQSPWSRIGGDDEAVKPSLTAAQEDVVAAIEDAIGAESFAPMVVHGVTGSGKTEVYLRAAELVLSRGENVLILVPEIALTPRLASILRARFGDQVAILHSALGGGERRDEWWRIRDGRARVVVGARAAVLAPVQNLGLVVGTKSTRAPTSKRKCPATTLATWRSYAPGTTTRSCCSAPRRRLSSPTLTPSRDGIGSYRCPSASATNRSRPSSSST